MWISKIWVRWQWYISRFLKCHDANYCRMAGKWSDEYGYKHQILCPCTYTPQSFVWLESVVCICLSVLSKCTGGILQNPFLLWPHRHGRRICGKPLGPAKTSPDPQRWRYTFDPSKHKSLLHSFKGGLVRLSGTSLA